MNFLRGLFGRPVKETPVVKDPYEMYYKFSIGGQVLEQTEDAFKLISSAALIEFDKHQNEAFNHLLIVRIHNTVKAYQHSAEGKEADYYFPLTSILKIEEQRNANMMDFTWVINENHKSILKFKYFTASEQKQYEQFRIMFGQLYFECIEKKSHNGSQQLYKNYIRKLEDIPMIEVNPRNRYPVFERNYLEKFNIPKDTSLRQDQVGSKIKRTQDEKADISQVLIECQDHKHVELLFSGSMYLFDEDLKEFQLIKNAIIFSVSKYPHEHVIEIRNLNSQVILFVSINQFLNYHIDVDQNTIKWLHVDDIQQIVYLVHFDAVDVSMQIKIHMGSILQEIQERINFQESSKDQYEQSSENKEEEQKAVYIQDQTKKP